MKRKYIIALDTKINHRVLHIVIGNDAISTITGNTFKYPQGV